MPFARPVSFLSFPNIIAYLCFKGISIFSDSIKKNDFARIAGLKDEGYIPSPKIIDELKGSAPAPTMIAVQKIFGLPSDAPGLSNIKLAQSDSKELGLNTEKSI